VNIFTHPGHTILRLDFVDDSTWLAKVHFSDGTSSRSVQIPNTLFKGAPHWVFRDNLVEDDVHVAGKRLATSWIVHDVPYVLRALDIDLNQED